MNDHVIGMQRSDSDDDRTTAGTRDDREEFGANIAGQSFNFKGSTTQFLVMMVVLIPTFMLCIVLYFLYQHEQSTAVRTKEGHALAAEFITAIKAFSTAQRETTCVMALPQEKRENDFTTDNSFCKRMARLQ